MSQARTYPLSSALLGAMGVACSPGPLGGELGFQPNAAGEAFYSTPQNEVSIALHGGANAVSGPICNADVFYTLGGVEPPLGIGAFLVSTERLIFTTANDAGVLSAGTFEVVPVSASGETPQSPQIVAVYSNIDSGVTASGVSGTVSFSFPNVGEVQGTLQIALAFSDGGSAGTLAGGFDVPLCTNGL